MIKFIIIYVLYLNICLNFNCNGKLINVEVKIKNDWKEKREFIYLKNVEIKERFVLIMNVKQNNKIVDYLYKNTESFYKIEVNPVNKVFIVKLCQGHKYISQLKMRILIEIANNEIVKKFLKNLGNHVFYI